MADLLELGLLASTTSSLDLCTQVLEGKLLKGAKPGSNFTTQEVDEIGKVACPRDK